MICDGEYHFEGDKEFLYTVYIMVNCFRIEIQSQVWKWISYLSILWG